MELPYETDFAIAKIRRGIIRTANSTASGRSIRYLRKRFKSAEDVQ